MGKKLDLALAVLNGAVGDHLARTGNGLATEMTLVSGGRPLPLEREALRRALPSPTGRVALLLHGLMSSEDIWLHHDGADYGALLQRDLGITPLYLRYNSGLAIADNGALLDALLARLMTVYPGVIEELIPIGYSMGGLVVRSACHVATSRAASESASTSSSTSNATSVSTSVSTSMSTSMSTNTGAPGAWLPRVRRALYVGTPHQGAPMERAGRVIARILRAVPDPYTQLAAQLAHLRSDGIKDLGDADLRHQDRAAGLPRIGLYDPRHPVPLLPQIQHYLVAGSLSKDPWLAALFGDSIVPLRSASDGAVVDAPSFALPPDHARIVSGVSHLDLAHSKAVYQHLRDWCAQPAPVVGTPAAAEPEGEGR